MSQKKDMIDSLFDYADKVVDGMTTVLKDVPEPDSDEDEVTPPSGRVIDIQENPQPLLKSDARKRGPREVTLSIRAIARKGDGVGILCETETHEVVVVNLSGKDWKTLCDNADWMRAVKE